MPVLEIGEKKILFIHIPKTGGTSLEEWLSTLGRVSFLAYNTRPPFMCSPHHFTWRDMQFLTRNRDWDYAFTVVRNPYDRMESEFGWRYRKHMDKQHYQVNFDTWVDDALKAAGKEPHHLDNHIRPQIDFLSPRLEVFRFEDGLENVFNTVAQRIGVAPPTEITHVNQRRDPVPYDWSAPLLKTFNAFYAEDFDALGYAKKPLVTVSGA